MMASWWNFRFYFCNKFKFSRLQHDNHDRPVGRELGILHLLELLLALGPAGGRRLLDQTEHDVWRDISVWRHWRVNIYHLMMSLPFKAN